MSLPYLQSYSHNPPFTSTTHNPQPTTNNILLTTCYSPTHYLLLTNSLFDQSDYQIIDIPLDHQTTSYTRHPPPDQATMSSTAHRRLLQEYRMLTNNPPDGITAGPVSEDDLLHWEAVIQGPEGTPFDGGVFPAELKFPNDYPLSPPTMKFVGEMWHPNGMNPPLLPLENAHDRVSEETISIANPHSPRPPKQSTQAAWSASPSSTRPATTPTTTSTPRSAGRPSSPSRRSCCPS